MKVRDIIKELNLEVCCGEEGLDRDVVGGYTSDLLSDVMGNSQEAQIWITIQTHKNIMAIASLKDLAAIVLVKGFKPDEDTVEQSKKEGIPILSTKEEAFEITGKIYSLIK